MLYFHAVMNELCRGKLFLMLEYEIHSVENTSEHSEMKSTLWETLLNIQK